MVVNWHYTTLHYRCRIGVGSSWVCSNPWVQRNSEWHGGRGEPYGILNFSCFESLLIVKISDQDMCCKKITKDVQKLLPAYFANIFHHVEVLYYLIMLLCFGIRLSSHTVLMWFQSTFCQEFHTSTLDPNLIHIYVLIKTVLVISELFKHWYVSQKSFSLRK